MDTTSFTFPLMAKDRLSGSPENKEVSRTQKSDRQNILQPFAGRKAIRNALLLAGGVTFGALLPPALQGCESGNGQERLGQTSEALASGWNSPTVPSLGVNANIAYVERSGPNITLYIVESGDIKKIGSSDGGATWNSPTLTPVSGANSGFNEFDFKVCGGKAYVVSERDGLSSKLYEGTWSGGVVSGLAAVPGTLNDDGANVNNVACDSGGTNIYASSDISSSNKRIHTAVIGTWTWSELTSCSDLTKDTYGIFVDTNDFYVGSDRTGTLGSLDLMVYNGGWNGTNCSGGVTNLNAISGSATVNDANTQGTLFKDSSGDLWYGDNGTIKWATMKTGTTDAGTDGAGGDAGTDGGGGSDGGAGGDGGAPGCFAQVTNNPENITIKDCSDTQLNAQVQGPATVQIGNKTFNFTEGQGSFNFSEPNMSEVSIGLAHEDSEPPTEADKIISNESGITLGFEGTHTTVTYPDSLNPNKAKGQFDIVAYTTVEGAQRAYDQNCTPTNATVNNCNPVDFTAPGSSEKGLIPAGVTMYRELSTGEVADDPKKFKTVPPVQDPGCSCTEVQDHTANNMALLLMAAGLGAVITRRKSRKKA